ncbi:MAG TPA: hypothetical protein VMH61_04615 [Candidatus Acidoferrales bacterium]|nr:hypothetical protein [Candidatus Acidoferrales bacterium]
MSIRPSACRTAGQLPAGSIAAFAAVALLVCRAACAQTIDPRVVVVNGPVLASVVANGRLYLGGSFTSLGAATGGGYVSDSLSGDPVAGWPMFDGPVYACASDGAGGWYVGGDFLDAGGVSRTRLAHLRADRSLDAWNPQADAPVRALVVAGGLVYAGGDFVNAGGQLRPRLAALDRASGAATAWNPVAYGSVYALAVHGSAVYAGGSFTRVGVAMRQNLAAIDTATALATSWGAPLDAAVYALAVTDSLVYVGGAFTLVGGEPRPHLAVFGLDGRLQPWTPQLDGDVRALALDGSILDVGGAFAHADGVAKAALAEYDASSHALRSWPSPFSGGEVDALASQGDRLLVGGAMTVCAGAGSVHLAALLESDLGDATPSPVPVNGPVRTLGMGRGVQFAGGEFTGLDQYPIRNLAVLDLATGSIPTWNYIGGVPPAEEPPAPDGPVHALATDGNTLYAGGSFDSVGSQGRAHLAAFDLATNEPTSWNPQADDEVLALAASGGLVYAGGLFTHAGGAARGYLAAFDGLSGAVAPFDPEPNNSVLAVAAEGPMLFAGGDFTQIGGNSRPGVAQIALASGQVTAWSVDVEGADEETYVDALAFTSSTVYLGGSFTTVDGQMRHNVAAVGATGALEPWDPETQGPVAALAFDGQSVWCGGNFDQVGFTRVPSLAVLDPVSGSATVPGAGTDGIVRALTFDGGAVDVGGSFGRVGPLPRAGLARLLPLDVSPPVVGVASPPGSDTLIIGSLRTLRWSASDDRSVLDVDVSISRSGPAGPWEPVAYAAPNTGTYAWNVTGPVASGQLDVRVQARDWAGNIGTGVSATPLFLATAPAPPLELALEPPHPNPLRGGGSVAFVLPVPEPARLTLYDLQGRRVAPLVEGGLEPGRHVVALPPPDLRAGVCVLRLQAGGAELKRRVVLLR